MHGSLFHFLRHPAPDLIRGLLVAVEVSAQGPGRGCDI